MRGSLRARAWLVAVVVAALAASVPAIAAATRTVASLRPDRPAAVPGVLSAAVRGSRPAAARSVAVLGSRALASTRQLTFTSSPDGFHADAEPVGKSTDWRWQNPLPAGVAINGVYFRDANTGWINGPDTIMKTTDGGATWHQQDTPRDFDGGPMFFFDALHGWCCDTFGLLKTSDGGEHWTSVDVLVLEHPNWSSFSTNGFTDIYFATSKIGFATEEFGGVHKTTNGGKTWKLLKGTASKHMLEDASFVGANRGWFVSWDGLFRTANGGKTWKKIKTPASDPYGAFSSVQFISAKVGWISGLGVYTPTAGGKTWKRQRRKSADYEYGTLHFADARHGWVTISGPSIVDGDVETPGVSAILRTDDGGATWTRIDTPGAENLQLFFLDANRGWSAGRTGFTSTTDGGRTWTSRVTGTKASFTDVSAESTSNAVAVGRDGLAYYTLDGGDHWLASDAETTQTIWALASVGASETWAVGDGGIIRHTTDGGATWEKQDSGTQNWLGDVSFVDALHGWASGGEGTLAQTTDGGAHWAAAPSAPLGNIYRVQFTDALHGWTLTDGEAALHKTADGGSSWTTVTPEWWQPGDAESLAFADADHGWVGGSAGLVAHTSDGGATWTQQQLGTGESIMLLHAVDASTAVAETWDGKVYRTVNGGAMWWLQAGPNCSVNDLDFAPGDTQIGWAVGNGGDIMKTTDGGGAAATPARISGVVRDGVTKKPLAGVKVEIPSAPTTYTDSTGHYEVGGLAPAIYYGAEFSAAGYQDYYEDVFGLDSGDNLVLNEYLLVPSSVTMTSSRLSGHTLKLRGAAAPARRVTGRVQYQKMRGSYWRTAGTRTGKSTADGRFSIARSLPAGTWRVRVGVASAGGYTSAWSAWKTVKVR